jgi:hypothetical protein
MSKGTIDGGDYSPKRLDEVRESASDVSYGKRLVENGLHGLENGTILSTRFGAGLEWLTKS